MPAPTITGVGISRVLKTIAAQGMKDLVLNRLYRRGKIRDEKIRVRVQANINRLADELRDVAITAKRIEELVVDPRQEILPEAADGFCGAQNGSRDAGFIEFDEGTIAFLNFDDVILNQHWRR